MKIIECPRDTMQGIKDFIPTQTKINYINSLLKVGFDTLDFGSFVSPKAIPQLADTNEVLEGIDLSLSDTKLLAICANLRGAEDIIKYDEIDYIGYPFSVSETFQMRNTNKNIKDSFDVVLEMQELATSHNKELVVYLSMAFGNPYNDQWHPDIVTNWAELMYEEGISIISLADTIGIASPQNIELLFSTIIQSLPTTEIGAHFHTIYDDYFDKIDIAFRNGCRRFDGALKGYGGCPMAKDELTGNMPTEKLIDYMNQKQIKNSINLDELNNCLIFANEIFNKYH